MVLMRSDQVGAGIVLFSAVVCLICGFSIRTLTVKDEGDFLRIFSGPLPLFKKNIHYSEINDITMSKSNLLLDGWGLHYGIGRGWIINIWGFDCVALKMGEKTFRIGTDDKEGLFAFLRQKLAEKNTY